MCFKYHVKEHVGKMYYGVNVPRWNFEIKSFVAQWIAPKEEDTPTLGAVKNCKSLWNVVGKGQIGMLQIILVSLESSQQRRVHGRGSMKLGLAM